MTIVRFHFRRKGFRSIPVRRHHRNLHKIKSHRLNTELEAGLEFSAFKGPSASLKLRKRF